MEVLIPLLEDLINLLGLDFVLRALVEAGVLPAWVLPDQNAAQEHEPYLIEQDVESIRQSIESTAYGLYAIKTQVNRNAVDVAGILSALSTIQTQISNIPAAPEAGTIAEQVWGYPNSGEDISAYSHLQLLERFAHMVGGLAAFVLQNDPFLVVETSWKYPPD